MGRLLGRHRAVEEDGHQRWHTHCAVRATNPFGVNWEADGTSLFGQREGIRRVPSNGGPAKLIVGAEVGEQMYGPQLLPGGEWVLFSVTTVSGATRWDEAQIVCSR